MFNLRVGLVPFLLTQYLPLRVIALFLRITYGVLESTMRKRWEDLLDISEEQGWLMVISSSFPPSKNLVSRPAWWSFTSCTLEWLGSKIEVSPYHLLCFRCLVFLIIWLFMDLFGCIHEVDDPSENLPGILMMTTPMTAEVGRNEFPNLWRWGQILKKNSSVIK